MCRADLTPIDLKKLGFDDKTTKRSQAIVNCITNHLYTELKFKAEANTAVPGAADINDFVFSEVRSAIEESTNHPELSAGEKSAIELKAMIEVIQKHAKDPKDLEVHGVLLRLAKSLGDEWYLDPNYVCAEDIAATAWLNLTDNDKKLAGELLGILEKNKTIISIDSVWNSSYFTGSSVKAKLHELYEFGFDSKTILEKVKGSINKPEVDTWLEKFLEVQHTRSDTQKVSCKELYKAGVHLNSIVVLGSFDEENMMNELGKEICSGLPSDDRLKDLQSLFKSLQWKILKI